MHWKHLAWLLWVGIVAAIAACGASPRGGAERTGTVSLPLTSVTPSGHTYRLSGASFTYAGASTGVLTPAPDQTSISQTLATGSYTLTLAPGWSLELEQPDGTFSAVTATLTSPNPVAFTIGDQQVTTVVFRFTTGGTTVALGNGTLDVAIAVTEDDAGPASDSGPAIACSVDGGSQGVTYNGGPVISNVVVQVVNWTSSVDANVQAQIGNFYSAILPSSYLAWLSQYDTAGVTSLGPLSSSNQRIGAGSYAGSITINPSNTTPTVSEDDIELELTRQVAAGHLPAPPVDAQGNPNGLYVVQFPPGVTIILSAANGSAQSCVQFCGAALDATIAGVAHAPYAIIADLGPTSLCAGGCGRDAVVFNNVTLIESAILANAITAPDISNGETPAWFSNSRGRIGDICNQQAATVGGFTVQKLWSNVDSACVALGSPTSPCGQ